MHTYHVHSLVAVKIRTIVVFIKGVTRRYIYPFDRVQYDSNKREVQMYKAAEKIKWQNYSEQHSFWSIMLWVCVKRPLAESDFFSTLGYIFRNEKRGEQVTVTRSEKIVQNPSL